MANKKISEFPLTQNLAGSDIFLIDHIGSTSTVAFSTVSDSINVTITNNLTGDTVIQKLSSNFIKKPTNATNGQVLTYNGSTSTWVASAAPTKLPSTALSGQVLTYDGSTNAWVASAASTGSGIGIGQTWQDVTTSRTAGVTYTNTTGRTITVIVGGSVGVGNTWTFTVDGIQFTYAVTGGSFGSGASHTCPIPPGSTYSASNFAKWLELR